MVGFHFFFIKSDHNSIMCRGHKVWENAGDNDHAAVASLTIIVG